MFTIVSDSRHSLSPAELSLVSDFYWSILSHCSPPNVAAHNMPVCPIKNMRLIFIFSWGQIHKYAYIYIIVDLPPK